VSTGTGNGRDPAGLLSLCGFIPESPVLPPGWPGPGADVIKVWDGITIPSWLAQRPHQEPLGSAAAWIAWKCPCDGAGRMGPATGGAAAASGRSSPNFVGIALPSPQGLFTCVNLALIPPRQRAHRSTTSLRTRLNTARFTGSILAGLSGLVASIRPAGPRRDHPGTSKHGARPPACLIILGTLGCAGVCRRSRANCQRPTGDPSRWTPSLRTHWRQWSFPCGFLGLYLLPLVRPSADATRVADAFFRAVMRPAQELEPGLDPDSLPSQRLGPAAGLEPGCPTGAGGCKCAALGRRPLEFRRLRPLRMVLVPLEASISPLVRSATWSARPAGAHDRAGGTGGLHRLLIPLVRCFPTRSMPTLTNRRAATRPGW